MPKSAGAGAPGARLRRSHTQIGRTSAASQHRAAQQFRNRPFHLNVEHRGDLRLDDHDRCRRAVRGIAGDRFFSFNLGANASENPTFSIIPLSGEEFTNRIATPFKDDVIEFLGFQGGVINRVMRLMASGIEVQKPEGQFVRFIENDPRRPREYEEFRRIAVHLQWLNNSRQLFVQSLVYKETLVEDFKGVPDADDINDGFTMGLRWRQKSDGNYELTRLKAGRVVLTNFDPRALTDQQRFELDERIKRNPSGFVYLEIRPDGPGGDFPIQGAIKLRSIFQILIHVARGIEIAKEFDVAPDPRTRGVVEDPAATFKLNVTDSAPEKDLPSIRHKGRHYTVNDTAWDRSAFILLSLLFQTAVGDIEGVGIPITISK